MRRLLLPTCLLLFTACPTTRADYPGPECCSTYPIYLCRPGFLSYPIPPYELGAYENCTGCNHGCGCHGPAHACGVITPNPYTCCFYGVTLSNYGLITPLHEINGAPHAAPTPSALPALPPVPTAPEKLPKTTAR